MEYNKLIAEMSLSDEVEGFYVLKAAYPKTTAKMCIRDRHSPVVEVVYLTCQYKKPMPTHVRIESAGKRSTALCEQISSEMCIRDRSGSMCSNDRITRARATAIVIQDFCESLGIPLLVVGHTLSLIHI